MRERLVRESEFDYNVLRSNEQWDDHRLRTIVTASTIAWLKPQTVLDPAGGDGSILAKADLMYDINRIIFGDISSKNCEYVKQYGWETHCDDVDDTLEDHDSSGIDVIVLSEILEHLENPDRTLQLAANAGHKLVASSPCMREGQYDDNPEHLWMFDAEGYQTMLETNGWNIIQDTRLKFLTTYDFQIYVCERALD